MAVVRFKFRSCPNFDTIDIGQQPSISIYDLKCKIALKNHLNLRHDFDLVFFDSVSGLEYKDENTRIANGSSVIVKRVPAKSCPSLREFDASAGRDGGGDTYYLNVDEPPVLDLGVNECDDFGVDLCLPPVANISDHQKLPSNINEKRWSGKLPGRDEKRDTVLPTYFNPKDSLVNEECTIVMRSKPIPKEQTRLDRAAPVENIAVESFNMPLELKCPLCTTYFKEAVMIPCCQHSFCESCIRLALLENFRCPTCSSAKCKPEDLLPNISLRQTIKRFLESQHLYNDLGNDLDRYAPDCESGIQTRQMSYAASVQPRDMQLNRCSTKVTAKLPSNTKCEPIALDICTEFQGENDPLKTAEANEEANSSTKKGQTFCDANRGGEMNFVTPGRLNKGLRTCYMCGSPDHLIRDCPDAANSHTNSWCGNVPFQGEFPGYAPQYWPGNPPHGRPYGMYCAPEMMMYNTNMAASTAFALSPYSSAMFSGYPVMSGSMQPGGVGYAPGIIPPQINQTDLLGLKGCAKPGSHIEAFERGSMQPGGVGYAPGIIPPQMNQTDLLGLKGCAKPGSHIEAFERGEEFDPDHNVNRQLDYAEKGSNHSGDSFTRRSERNHRSHDRSDDDKYSHGKREGKISRSSEGGRNFRNAQLDGSTSEKNVPSSGTRPPVEKHENSYRCSKRNERRGHHESDSSHIYHHSNKKDSQRRREHERRSGREFYSHYEPGLERSYSSSDGRWRRDGPGPTSRHSEKNPKLNGKDICHEQGKVVKYSYDDYEEDYNCHKKRKYH